MLKFGLDRIDAAGTNMTAVRSLIVMIREHVGRAYEQVNGMLCDVMEVSRDKSNIRPESLSLKDLLENVLSQVFCYHQDSRIWFEYSLNHRSLLYVDHLKVQRVFTNILDNARQAMKGEGRIWIWSREVADGSQVEITVGNSKSVIADEDLPQLFDAFFTKNKKGGTGLGLAICKKVVSCHGGTIHCRSSVLKGTEFIFTLPTVRGSLDNHVATLPTSSLEIREAFTRSLAPKVDETVDLRRQAVIECAQGRGREFRVLVIDDEPLCSDGIRSQFIHEARLKNVVTVDCVFDFDEALAVCRAQTYDLLISDVDLGRGTMSGFDLVRMIRAVRPEAKICVHSNRSLPEDYRRALEAGADAFLPKPMSTVHLLGLLLPVRREQERRKGLA